MKQRPQTSEANPFPKAELRDVVGSLKYTGKPKSIRQMKAGIAREVARRHEQGRY